MTLAYDPRRPEVIADPYPALACLRETDPVHWSPALRGWVLTRYADVRAALADSRLSADRISPFLAHRGADSAVATLGRTVGLWAVFTDPPRHTRLRGLLNRAFTTRAVERLRPRIQAIADQLLDRVAGRGEMDLVRDFANPLPLTVIAELIGVPAADRERLKGWSDELAAFVGSALATPDKYGRAGRGLDEMREYFGHLIAARRAGPRDDLLSALVAARERGDMLSEEELVATAILLLFAGHETTTNLIGNGTLALWRHPAEARALADNPGLAPAAVEELLRYDGPTGAMVRIATEEVQLGGQRVARGDRIFTMINAANRDPTQFPDPDRLDLVRDPNRHLAFGHGIHFCLGAPLARLEGEIAFPTLLRRLPHLRVEIETPEWLDSLVFRGMRSLPVSFRPGPHRQTP